MAYAKAMECEGRSRCQLLPAGLRQSQIQTQLSWHYGLGLTNP